MTRYERAYGNLAALGVLDDAAYLRDLKASHDKLMAAAKAMDSKIVIEYGFLDHQYELSQLRIALKAAEALR